MTHRTRRHRLVVAAGLVGAGVAALVGLSGAPAHADAQAGSTAVPVDRQDYVADQTTTNPQTGAPQDAYDNDPSSIHVGVSGGQEFARSFIHLALDYLPQGSAPTGATVSFKLTQQSDASNTGAYPLYQVNPSSVALTACVLTSELPAQFNPTSPPAYDCSLGSTSGKVSADGTTWTFDLGPLVGWWKAHGNTGAALVPSASALQGNGTWQVAFYKSRSASTVAYAPVTTAPAPSPQATPAAAAPAAAPAAPSASRGSAAAAPPATSSAAAPSPAVAPAVAAPFVGAAGAPVAAAGVPSVPGVATTTAPAATAAPPASPTAAAPTINGPTIQHIRTGGAPVWPWVLIACLAVAAAAIGLAHRDAIVAALPRSGAIWRTHPRAYAVAAAALAWGMVFGAYSAARTGSRTFTVASSTGDGAGAAATGAGAPAAPSGAGVAGGAGTASLPQGGISTPGLTPTGVVATPGPAGGPATAGAPAAGSRLAGASASPGSPAAPTAGGTTAAPAPGAPAPAAAGPEFSGAGTTRTINGVPVFFPAGGGVPEAELYSGAQNTEGIDAKSIRICAHAALTYGSAFHISPSDLDVYWEKVNDSGGINGRKVVTNYQNDNYDPGTAVQAAQACKDWGTFYLVGGIGFDQIPAVRQWAEQNHMPYLHHIATIEGTQGLRYSFSALPTVEQFGQEMGQVAAKQFPGKKVGIIYRQSSNWTPGVDSFTQTVKAAGMPVVGSYGTQINQGDYTQEITQLQAAGAQVVFSWENALAEVEMIKQAQAQSYHPAWLVNPFNLITSTLGTTALDQDIWGAAAWDSYDPGFYGAGFGSYAADIHEFEAEYSKYDPGAQISTNNNGNDLLFLNWEAERYEGALLTACGTDCTRNKLVGLMLAGFNQNVPPNCPADFSHTDDHHHAGYTFNVEHQVKDPNGRANFVPVARCVTSY